MHNACLDDKSTDWYNNYFDDFSKQMIEKRGSI